MRKLVILPTLLKSMFYQGNWNITNMQGTGFRWLLKDFFKHNKTELPSDFDLSPVYYFNTNPYLVTFILGLLLKETQMRGKISDYDKIYASALAALGDTFFWHSLRPFAFFISLWAILINPVLLIILYFVVFNLFNIVFRILGFYYGYTFGANVMQLFNQIKFNKWSRVYDGITTFMAGIVIAYVIKYQAVTDSINIIKSILLFIVGVIISKWVRGPLELIIVVTILAVLILFGV